MARRFQVRSHIVAAALWQSLLTVGRRRSPDLVRRVLVTHHPQMLGDTLLLTPLLAKLRQRYSAAEIVLTASPTTAALYGKHPYGVQAMPYDPRNHKTLRTLFGAQGFDLAIVPGDSRYSWLARALGARWVVGFAGDRPASKNWMMDQLTPYPNQPGMWGDMAAALVDGAPPAPYRPEDWPAPDYRTFDMPQQPYCVLHVGASTQLKLWGPEKWRALASYLTECGLRVVWSGGHNEQRVVEEIDATGQHRSLVGQLDLPQLWHLLANAALLVCPDTGVAHLGRIVDTPTVTLFGPGSPVLCGVGEFWKNSPYRAVTVEDFPCRDQRVFFRRSIVWVRRCGRGTNDCVSVGACMNAIQIEDVQKAIAALGVSA